MSVIVDATPVVIERIKYSAYGVAFGIPAGDYDGDGVFNSGDTTNMTSGPDIVAGDVDLDGDCDANDDTAAGGSGAYATVGRGKLSRTSTGNRRGYAAYEHDMNMAGTLGHVRYRVLRFDLGRWLTRDPIGYEGGESLYGYVSNGPVQTVDAMGLLGDPPAREPSPWDTSPCKRDYVDGSGSQLVDKECAAACRGETRPDGLRRCSTASPPAPMFCCVCTINIRASRIGWWISLTPEARYALYDCTRQHEETHWPQPCSDSVMSPACRECYAYRKSVACIEQKLRDKVCDAERVPANRIECRKVLERERDEQIRRRDQECNNCPEIAGQH